MRLPEERIKQAILHPDVEVRRMAVRYFADSFSPDPTIMPLVIQAVEKYGRNDFLCHESAEGLVQTDETFLWFLAELARDADPTCRDWERYTSRLCDLLAETDAALLAKHESAVADNPGVDAETQKTVTERIRLLNADPDACWTELQAFCEQNKAEQNVKKIDFDHAYRLVEAIARHPDKFADQVFSILDGQVKEEFDDDGNSAMSLLEPFAIRIAGAMQLAKAIPLIIERLNVEDDLLLDECERALWKIGGDTVVEALSANYVSSEVSYRLSVLSSLERIHTDLAAMKLLELLPTEKNSDLKAWLGRALLWQFDSDGIEPLRQLILRSRLDPEMRGLRADLLTACTLMDVTIPELEQWREDARHDAEANRKYYFRKHPDLAKLSALMDDNRDDDDDEQPIKQKVGRNDSCPCGSGKKFKKCCLKK
jgi:hypothetical protein